MDTEDEVRQFVHDYGEVFSTADPEAIAAHFHEPAMLVGERVRVLETREDAQALFTAVLDGLVARGYDRSVADEVEAEAAGKDRARARVQWVRYAADGVLERLTTTHVFRRTDDGWKMVVLLPHG
jgi:ketosteroid isomerase-like protein